MEVGEESMEFIITPPPIQFQVSAARRDRGDCLQIENGRLVPAVHAGREHRHGYIPGRGAGPGQSTRPQSASPCARHEGRVAGCLIRRIVFAFVVHGTGGEWADAGYVVVAYLWIVSGTTGTTN